MFRIFRVAYGPNVGEERAGGAAPHKGLSVDEIGKLPYGSRLLAGLTKAKAIARTNATRGNVLVSMPGGGYEIWPATALANYNAGKKPMGELAVVTTGPYRSCLYAYRQMMMGVAPEIAQ
jgi:hypothetical protein